ncbi:MAG: hypothetical protein AB7O97_22075 [Planctomycetota bacterium]
MHPLPAPAVRPLPRDPNAPPRLSRPNLEGERALKELTERLKAAPKSTDPLKRALAHAARKTATEPIVPPKAKPTVKAPTPTAPPPGVERVDYAIDRDPREDEPWFLELPEAEQERLRTHWHWKRHESTRLRSQLRTELLRSCTFGVAIFGAIGLVLALLVGIWALLWRLSIAGAVGGLIGRIAGRSRFSFAAAGVLCGGAALGGMLFSTIGMSALVLCTWGLALVGYDLEIRRSGGFGPRG